MEKKIIIASVLFFAGIATWFLLSNRVALEITYLKYLGTFLGTVFLLSGIYGLATGRVYGRSWKHYFGGWCERNTEPYYYWSYVFMYFFVGTVVLISCLNVFW